MAYAEHSVTREARETFKWNGFVIIPQLVDGRNAPLSVAKSNFDGIIDIVSDAGINLGLDLDGELARHGPGNILPLKRGTRAHTYELPDSSNIAYSLGQRSVAAVAPLVGSVWVWSANGRICELVEPGDVAFTSGETYYLEPSVNESATALVVTGERIGSAPMVVPDFITA